MSLVTTKGRISVKSFARVPPLGVLSSIQLPNCDSLSNISSNQEGVDLSEGCMVTKSVRYTHQLVHWISAAHKGDPTEVETLLDKMRIIPYSNFMLNDPCNLAFLDPFVHISLDLYGFIAVAPSISTLEDLIEMVRADNAKRQKMLDEEGIDPDRSLDFLHGSFMDPQYELVVLRPEHFLPVGSVLPIYDPGTKTHKVYVPAQDRRLRESTQASSPRLPAFRHTLEKRHRIHHLNVFLVAINAEIKFQRYLEEIQLQPPKMSLPDDVLCLMQLTQELIELIYWEAKPTKGSEGESIIADLVALQNRSARPDVENSSSTAVIEDAPSIDEEMPKVKWEPPWPQDTSLETCMAHARALMDSYGDSDLFEPTSGRHQYSDKTAVEAWTKEISPGPHPRRKADDVAPHVRG